MEYVMTAYSEVVLNFRLTSLGWTCSLSAERQACRWDALVASSLHFCKHRNTAVCYFTYSKACDESYFILWGHTPIMQLFLQVCDPVEFGHGVLWALECWSLSLRSQYQHKGLHDHSGSLNEKQAQPNFSCIVDY